MSVLTRIKVVLIVMGALLLVIGIRDCIYENQTPLQMEDMVEREIKKGASVEGNIYINLGAYETYYSTNNGIKNKSSEAWYYAIPVGDESYMGIKVNVDKMGDVFERQFDQSWDYMMYDDADIPDPIYIKGIICKMTKEDEGYFRTYMKDFDFSEAELNQYALPYYISLEDHSGYLGFMILGGVLAAIGVALCFLKKN